MTARLFLPLGAVLISSLSACAPAMTGATVPAALKPPAGTSEVLRATGRGVQIYTCQAATGAAPAWSLRAPDALLTDAGGRVVASHGAGPSWTAPDGSRVVGTCVASADSPVAGAIPWLLLSGQASGAGALARVSYVQRLDTVGGVAPGSGCDASALGRETRVPYSATYVFFSGP